jgi:hypothetical protein
MLSRMGIASLNLQFNIFERYEAYTIVEEFSLTGAYQPCFITRVSSLRRVFETITAGLVAVNHDVRTLPIYILNALNSLSTLRTSALCAQDLFVTIIMATLPIPLNDGTSIPWLGFGSGTALYNQDATASVAQAIKAGFRHIDAAQMYQNEESVGAGIAASGVPRSELYVTTKLAKPPAGVSVRDTLVESLRKLRLNYVDLFLIHVPNKYDDLKSVWKAMEEVKKEGLTKSIGVSNFKLQHLQEIFQVAAIPPVVNQVRQYADLY